MRISTAVSYESAMEVDRSGLTSSYSSAQREGFLSLKRPATNLVTRIGSSREPGRGLATTRFVVSCRRQVVGKTIIKSQKSSDFPICLPEQRHAKSSHVYSNVGRSLLRDMDSVLSTASLTPMKDRLLSTPCTPDSLDLSFVSSIQRTCGSGYYTPKQRYMNMLPERNFSGIFKSGTLVTVRTDHLIASSNTVAVSPSVDFPLLEDSSVDALERSQTARNSTGRPILSENTTINHCEDVNSANELCSVFVSSIKSENHIATTTESVDLPTRVEPDPEKHIKGTTIGAADNHEDYAEHFAGSQTNMAQLPSDFLSRTDKLSPVRSHSQRAICASPLRAHPLHFLLLNTRQDSFDVHNHYRRSASLDSMRASRSCTTLTNRKIRDSSLPCSGGPGMIELFETGLHTTLWVSSQDGSIEVRSMTKPRTVLGTIPKTPVSSSVTTLLCIGSNKVAAGQANGKIRIFDACTLKEIQEVQAHTAAITCMTMTTMLSALPPCIVPNQKDEENDRGGAIPTSASYDTLFRQPVTTFLTGSLDWTIGLWHSKMLTLVARLEGHRSGVSAIVGNVCDSYAISGSVDGTIRLWNLLTKAEVRLEEREQRPLVQHQHPNTRKRRVCRKESVQKALNVTKRSAKNLPYGLSSSITSSGTVFRHTFRLNAFMSAKISDDRSGDYMAKQTPSKKSCFSAFSFSPTKDNANYDLPRSRTKRRACFSLLRGSTEPGRKGNNSGIVRNYSFRTVKESKFKTTQVMEEATTTLHYVQDQLRALNLVQSSCNTSCKLYFPCCYSTRKDFSNPRDFNWPIRNAHNDVVSGLVVVQDRLLISTSRDGTAKVFGLPCGVFLRCLTMPIKAPLSTVVFDPQQCRLILGVVNGTLLEYDLLSPEIPMMSQVNPPVISSSSVYIPLRVMTMKRFFFISSRFTPCKTSSHKIEQDSMSHTVGIRSVAQIDRTTMTRDSTGRVATSRVGEPAFRELDLVAKQRTLQIRVQECKAILSKAANIETLEGTQLEYVRRNALIMQRVCTRNLLLRYFLVLQSWGSKKLSLRSRFLRQSLFNFVSDKHTMRIYWDQWGLWSRERCERRWSDMITLLEGCLNFSTSNAKNIEYYGSLKDSRDMYAEHEHIRCAVIAYQQHACRQNILRCVFYRWRMSARPRMILRQRENIFKQLLLLFRDPQRGEVGVRQISLTKMNRWKGRDTELVSVLHALTESSEQFLRWYYYKEWRSFIVRSRDRIVRRGNDVPDPHSYDEPRSLLLVCNLALRAVFFKKWRRYALFIAKTARVREEKRTIHREWLSLQNISSNTSSLGQLYPEETELERNVVETVTDHESLRVPQFVLEKEVVVMQRSQAMRILLGSFFNAPFLNYLIGQHTNFNQLEAHSIKSQCSNVRHSVVKLNQQPNTLTKFGLPCVHHLSVIGSHLGIDSLNICHHPVSIQANIADASGISNVTQNEHFSPTASVYRVSGKVHSSSCLFNILQAIVLSLKGEVFNCFRDGRAVVVAHSLVTRLCFHRSSTTPVATNHLFALNASSSFLSAKNFLSVGHNYQYDGVAPRLSKLSYIKNACYRNHRIVRDDSPGSVSIINRCHCRFSAAMHNRNSATPCQANKHSIHFTPHAASNTEGSGYKSLAEAFDSITQELIEVLRQLARDAGIDLNDNIENLPISPDNVPLDYEHACFSSSDKESMQGIGRRSPSAKPPLPSSFCMKNLHCSVLSSSPLCKESMEKQGSPLSAFQQRVPQEVNPCSTERESQDSFQSLHLYSMLCNRPIPSKSRHQIVNLVVKLIVLFDSFTAHRDVNIDDTAGISTRGSTSRALATSCLCSDTTVALLIHYVTLLLVWLEPRLWERQIELKRVADIYFRSIETNFTDGGGNTTFDLSSFRSSCLSDVQVNALNACSATVNSNCTPSSENSRGRNTSMQQHCISNTPPRQLHFFSINANKVHRNEQEDRQTDSYSHSRAEKSVTNSSKHSHYIQHPVLQPGISATRITPNVGSTSGGYRTARTPSCAALAFEDDLDVEEVSSRRSHDTFCVSVSHCGTPRFISQRSVSILSSPVIKPYLGFRVNVNHDADSSTRISIKEVISIYENADGEHVKSPASVAGLQVGDRILRFAGYTVTDLAAFNAIVSRHARVNAELPVVVNRNGETLLLNIRVGSKLSS